MPFLGTTGGGSVKQYGGQANLGYFIKNSLRFRSSAGGHLTRTPASSTNRQIWTYSTWLKRSDLSSGDQTIIAARADDNNRLFYSFGTGGAIDLFHNVSGTAYQVSTTAVFRDPSAWYHFVVAVDTTQATAANRVKLYVNGVQLTLTITTTDFPPQNTSTQWNNNGVIHTIAKKDTSATYSDCYLAETYAIDGQQLTPSSFGKTDSATGQWTPIRFNGTYGTNGFYLNYADKSAATAAAIGKDSSGNGNNWTPNNISVTAGLTYDAMIDSPTRSTAASNYATLNPLTRPVGGGGAFTVGQGNLQTAMSYIGPDSTIAMSSGKWYWEVIPTGGTSGYNPRIGIVPSNHGTYTGTSVGDGSGTYGYDSTGQKGSGGTYASYGSSYADADVIGVALDMDNGKIWFSKNGVWNASGDPAAGTNAAYTSITGEYFASVGTGGNGGGFTCHFNFGQRPFSYTPPSGFKSLNTFNLP